VEQKEKFINTYGSTSGAARGPNSHFLTCDAPLSAPLSAPVITLPVSEVPSSKWAVTPAEVVVMSTRRFAELDVEAFGPFLFGLLDLHSSNASEGWLHPVSLLSDLI
jgi:hypothetical protein